MNALFVLQNGIVDDDVDMQTNDNGFEILDLKDVKWWEKLLLIKFYSLLILNN